jgi:putative ABC transport system ATP-binding protein
MSGQTKAVVSLEHVQKVYGRGNSSVRALDDVSISFQAGSFTAIMGPSGSGKSTLLHCAAGLDTPTAGEIRLAGSSLKGLSETQLTLLRRDRVAFIFQSYNLMPALSVWDNIMLPSMLGGHSLDKQWVKQVVDRVGLSERIHHRPGELSGGQRQRVAIARALASQPDVTFADEPTGALDTQTAREILSLLRDLAELGQTVIMVTHDPVAASYAQNVVFLVDGHITTTLSRPSAAQVSEQLTRLDSMKAGSRHV